MQKRSTAFLRLSPPARRTLLFGLGLTALLLLTGCVLMLQAGTLSCATISDYRLALRLEQTARSALFFTVILSGFVQERSIS